MGWKHLNQLIAEGADIQWMAKGRTFRAPIASMQSSVMNGYVFEFPWAAEREVGDGLKNSTWKHDPTKVRLGCIRDTSIKSRGQGRLYFQNVFYAALVESWSVGRLNPSDVQGLPPDWQRFLKHYPGLAYDRRKILRLSRTSDKFAAAAVIPKQKTISCVLELLGNNEIRMEFLQFYVQRVNTPAPLVF